MKRKTHEQFLKEAFSINPNIKFLSKYILSNKKIFAECLICNYKWKAFPNDILQGRSNCPDCSGQAKLTHRRFIKKAFKIHGNEFKYLTKCTGGKNKIKIKHKVCGYEFWRTPNNHLKGQYCLKCQCYNSKGERRIRKFLKENKISFKEQKRFKDCRNKLPLPFDFYVFINKRKILIEYDGTHHFGIGKYANKSVIENDLIKNNYAIKNNIKLIRIPYTKLKLIEEILLKELYP